VWMVASHVSSPAGTKKLSATDGCY
jgi:hypothetical protein